MKHVPIFWKLSFAFMGVILIVLVVDSFLPAVNELSSDKHLRIVLTFIITSVISMGLAWLIVHYSIKESVRKLAEGMNRLVDKKFNTHIDENITKEFSSLASSFNDVVGMITAVQAECNKNQDYLQGVVESTSDIIITVDRKGKILTFNSGAEKALGYLRSELIGVSIELLWANPQERDKAIERLKYGDNVVNIETQFLTKTGEARDVLLTFSLMRNLEGEMIGTFGISKDITEVKRLQKELVQSQRFIAIGQVFTGIQHSLKNMLNAAKGGAYMVRTGLSKDDRTMLTEGWEIVQEAIDRMTKMSSDMLKFVKGWVPKFEFVDLTKTLSEIDHAIKKSAEDRGIEFLTDVSPELKPIKCDTQMIHTAVMDIVSNALDACDWKDFEKNEKPKVTLKSYQKNGSQDTIIEVQDNGCGMTDNVKANIFTPFYSTKSKTGTGLGMSIASRMINAHRGKILVESEPDKGTLFQIVLPKDSNHNQGD